MIRADLFSLNLLFFILMFILTIHRRFFFHYGVQWPIISLHTSQSLHISVLSPDLNLSQTHILRLSILPHLMSNYASSTAKIMCHFFLHLNLVICSLHLKSQFFNLSLASFSTPYLTYTHILITFTF